jgi:hypothetical protein
VPVDDDGGLDLVEPVQLAASDAVFPHAG